MTIEERIQEIKSLLDRSSEKIEKAQFVLDGIRELLIKEIQASEERQALIESLWMNEENGLKR